MMLDLNLVWACTYLNNNFWSGIEINLSIGLFLKDFVMLRSGGGEPGHIYKRGKLQGLPGIEDFATY